MKNKYIIAFIILTVNIIKAQDTTLIINAPHHGIIKSVKNYQIESVESYGCITIYLYDKALKPISNNGITGEILFFYSAGASLNKQLIPKADNSFLAEVLNSSYVYYTVNLNIFKNTIKIKFDNTSGLADNELKKINRK